MNHRRRPAWALIVGVSLTLGACTDSTSTRDSDRVVGTGVATSVQTARVENTSTPTLIPTNTLSPTPRPTDIPILPTPALPPDIAEDFFFTDSYPDCQLPCWQGLIVGESGRDDVQRMFDTVFGFSGSMYPIPNRYEAPPPGMDLMLHEWYLSEQPPYGIVVVSAWVDEDTDLLQGLAITWTGTAEEVGASISPQRVITEIGAPAQMLASLRRGGQGADLHARIQLLMFYDSGMSFWFSGESPATVTLGESGETYSTNVCLGDHFSGAIHILEPLANNATPSPLQESIYSIPEGFLSIQELLDVSMESIDQRSQQENNPCFSVDDF